MAQFWPDHPVALLARARALRDERPDEAVAAFRAVTKARPDYPFGHRDLIGGAWDVGLVDEARRAARTLLSLGGSRENIDAAVPALREGGASLEAAVALDRRAGLDPLQDAWRRALSQGATADGVALLHRAVAFEPDGVLEPLLDLEEVSAPRAAKARLEEAVRRFPHDVGLKVRLARLVAAFDGVQPALAILREHPFDQRALFLAVELGEVPPWQERLSLGDEVIQQRRALLADPFAGFGSLLLLDDVERHFADDGSALVVRHFVAELRSKEALDGYGELRVEDDERLLRLRVVKPDGSVVEPERHAQVADISLTGLSPYDVVEYLSVTFDGSGRDGTFWEMRGLDGPAPALRRSYAVTWSEKLEAQMGPVTLRADNGLARPPVETSGGRRRATFLVENVPALLAEPSSVAAEESERLAGVSFHLDQDFWRRSRGRGLASLSRQDPWVAVCAQRIAGAGDTDARLARVFQFVADRIVPADAPGDATTVLATGRGRRLPLFVALARAAGLTPEPIALHPTLAVPTTIPTASLFSTVAVRVRTPTGPHVILLQDQLALIDDLPPIFRQAAVLPLFGPGETAPLPDAVIDDEPVRVQVDLGLEGESLTGLIVVRMPAYLSELLRPSLRQATDEQLVQMLEAALAASLPGVQISAVRLPNLQQAATSLVIGADVRVPLKSSEGVVRYEHLFAGGAAAAFGVGQPLGALNRVADRRRALRVNPESELLELQLRLPRNASFVETPRPVSAQAGPIRLVQRAEVQEGTLIWRRELIRDAARVGPGAWPGMRAQLGTLLSRADGRIAFVLPRPSYGPAPGPAPTNDVR